MTSSGGTISWQEIGIEISIPSGAVPEGEALELRVRPCLSGPFVLPEGHQLASPVYLIRPAFDFANAVRLSVAHFVGLDSSRDCDRMTFITSSSSPTHGPQTKYEFKLMKGGIFRRKEDHGVIYLKHLCLLASAKQTHSSTGEHWASKNGKVMFCVFFLIIQCTRT